jgi:pilus assembly protein Flp/PilA
MREQFSLWIVKSIARLGERKNREDGQALAEYALILALVAVFCIAALQALGGSISDTLNAIASAIAAA